MILILRFYHLPANGAVLHRSLLRQRDGPPWESGMLAGNLTKQEECVVAWGAVRLTRSESACEFLQRRRHLRVPGSCRISMGSYTMGVLKSSMCFCVH